jgi:hypothetical protein
LLTDFVILHINVYKRRTHAGRVSLFVVQLDDLAIEAARNIYRRLRKRSEQEGVCVRKRSQAHKRTKRAIESAMNEKH